MRIARILPSALHRVPKYYRLKTAVASSSASGGRQAGVRIKAYAIFWNQILQFKVRAGSDGSPKAALLKPGQLFAATPRSRPCLSIRTILRTKYFNLFLPFPH